jgi:putative PIN family toxin of toxin-antitoxin system
VKAAPRVVLDTNVVLSALLFNGEFPARVRAAWQASRFTPLASTATAAELVRVLAYPKFKLSTAEQEELLADYVPWVQVVRIPSPPPITPAVRDPFDLPFVQLAIAGKAHALVSGDRDLLMLAGTQRLCAVLSISEFCQQMLAE